VLGVDIWEMCRRRDEVCVEGEMRCVWKERQNSGLCGGICSWILGWRGRRYEETQTGSVSMFVCVLRERCSLGLSGGCVYVLCRDLCM